MRAVDLGAGTGFLTLALAAEVEEVLAVDVSPVMADALAVRAADLGSIMSVAWSRTWRYSTFLRPASTSLSRTTHFIISAMPTRPRWCGERAGGCGPEVD